MLVAVYRAAAASTAATATAGLKVIFSMEFPEFSIRPLAGALRKRNVIYGNTARNAIGILRLRLDFWNVSTIFV